MLALASANDSRVGTGRAPAVGLALALAQVACTDRVTTAIEWPPTLELTQRIDENCILIDGGMKCWATGTDERDLADYDPADGFYSSARAYFAKLGRGEKFVAAPLPFVDLGTDVTVLSVTSGKYHRCAAIASRGVKCWGWNGGWTDAYNLGVTGPEAWLGDTPATRGDALPFVDLGVTDVVMVSGPCALFGSGRVKCWGLGAPWLGLGDRETRGDDPGEMGDALPFVDLGADFHAVGIDVSAHACAWSEQGRVKCWGYNDRGQLGVLPVGAARGDDPGEMGDDLPYVDLGAGVRVVQVAVGGEHTCALTDEGRVKCWGANSTLRPYSCGTETCYDPPEIFGRLGLEDQRDRLPPLGDDLPYVDLGSDARAVALELPGYRSCALLDDGRLKCWGALASYETPGPMGDELPALDFGRGRSVRAIDSSTLMCALLDDDTVRCWNSEPMCTYQDPADYPVYPCVVEPDLQDLPPVATRADLFGEP